MNLKDFANFDFKKIDLKKIDLKKIDLNSIDIQALKNMIFEKKQLVAQGAVVLISIVVLIAMVTHFQDQSKQMKNEIKVLEGKKEAIIGYEKELGNNVVFKKAMPQEIDEDQLSNQITDYAAQNSVTISSFSMEKKSSDQFSESFVMRISVNAKSYKDFLSFMQSIETSEYSFRIDSCILTPNKNMVKDDPDQALAMQADLNVVYTILKK